MTRPIPLGVTIRFNISEAEQQEIAARLAKKGSFKPCAGSRCAACPRILEESETGIRGYASGEELELCRKCASFVNTKEDIDAAEADGAEVKAKPITYRSDLPIHVQAEADDVGDVD